MKRFVLALTLWLFAVGASAANVVPWTTTDGVTNLNEIFIGGCATVRFTTANETDESKLLYIGGLSVTFQSDGDAAGGGGSEGDLFACSSPDGNHDGTQDTTACTGLGFRDSDGNGTLDDNTVDGGTSIARGTLTPITIAGWLYVNPDESSITGSEVLEVIVCAVR